MRSFFFRIWAWVTGWFRRPDKPLRATWIEELPDHLDPGTVYVAGENGHVWFAAMICPCGCGETLYMNLQQDRRPCWRLTVDQRGAVTLHPSVWRQVGCRSHFFLRQGVVQWAILDAAYRDGYSC